MKTVVLTFAIACLGAPASLWAATEQIQNDSLEVDYDDAASTFSIKQHGSDHAFISQGQLPIKGSVAVSEETDPRYGMGRAIVVSDSNGQSAHLLLFPRVPFAFLHETFGNLDSQAKSFDKVPILTFTPDLGLPLNQLRLRGTGGLSNGDNPNAGSYEWLTLADPLTRHGVVAGYITQFKSTGVLAAHDVNNQLSVEVRAEYGHLNLKAGEKIRSETLALGYFDDARLGLELWADQVAKTYHVHLPPQPAGYCTWYAEQNGGSSDEKNVALLADFVKKNLEPYGMSFVEIDDGWQSGDSKGNGSSKNFTEYNPNGPYKSGIKAIADQLNADGLVCGLWFIPFAGSYNDDWFKDKQDLFVKKPDGKPYDVNWGGTCLDMTNPAARAYTSKVVHQITHDWGVRYVKLDGFWTGSASPIAYVNDSYKDDGGSDAVFFDPSKTNVEALRMGVKVVRAAAGPGVFLLGCNVAQNMRTYGGTFGALDAMRVGPDNNGSFGGAMASAAYGSRNYFLNRRVWYNDPDPSYVRASMSLDEARFSASWASISGQLYTNSDWIPALPAERLEIIKRTVLPHGMTARPVDFFDNDTPRIWQVIDDQGTTRRDVIALFNTDDKQATITVPLAKMQLPPGVEFVGFDFWANTFMPSFKDTLTSTLPPHSCQVIAVRPVADHPFVLSTSRHVTQGMVDLTDEKWNPLTKVLSGNSTIVAGDPYELRIVAPPGWKLSQGSVDQPNATITSKSDDGIRSTIQSPDGGTVSWKLTFNQ